MKSARAAPLGDASWPNEATSRAKPRTVLGLRARARIVPVALLLLAVCLAAIALGPARAATLLVAIGLGLAAWHQVRASPGRAADATAADLERVASALAWAAVVESSSDLTVVFDEEGRIRLASPAASPLLGRSSEFLAGEPVTGLVHPEDRPKLAAVGKLLEERGYRSSATTELRVSHVTNGWIDVEAVVTHLGEHPHVAGMVVSFHDLRERKAREEELVHLALHDALTKLANRALFGNHVEHALAHGGARR